MRTTRPATRPLLTTLGALLVLGSAACGGDEPTIQALYNPNTQRVLIDMVRELEDGETMMVSVRRGNFGQLDCAAQASAMDSVVDHDGLRFYGPVVDQSLLDPFYGPEWAYEPTPEMLAALDAGTDSIIDFCVMKGSEVVEQIEFDLFKAVDNGENDGLGGKADDNEHGEVGVNSAQAYGELCVGQMGEIPFFEKQGEFKYGTYNCLDSTPIPMTVTDAGGNVDRPDGEVSKCDKPQYIYSLCEQGPRVASRINDQGTRWVLLCRKSIGGLASDQFNDIAMIGHNPFTGKTCFFQNALYQKKDGGNVPHPADREKSTNLWSGVHGGLGSGIQCSKCHDADPFVHSPWIDGAKDANGRSVVPKMGEDQDMPIGANDAPYYLVNQRGQNWRVIDSLTSPAVAACTKCHRMGKGGEWQQWVTRIEQTDASWENIVTDHGKKFENARWMPTDLSGLTAATWASSPYATAIAEIKRCGQSSDCASEKIPTAPGGNTDGNGRLRNPVTLSDSTLATRAVGILAASGCKDCHTSSRTTFRKWADQTAEAEGQCLANLTGGSEKQSTPAENEGVGKDEVKTYGPYDVAIGGTFKAQITGSGDADLYVKRFAKATKDNYDCRPFKTGSRETCGADQFKNFGPGKFYVTIIGKSANTSKFTLKVTHTAKGDGQQTPAEVISCLRQEPREDSPFLPHKLGMYTVLSSHGWFSDLFHAAYNDAESRDAWVINFAKFKARTSMPKGNHPRLSQADADVVVEWFARGVPNLDSVVQNDPPPTTCSNSISSEMSTHASTMATQGWRAVNAERGLAMYGCSGNGNPISCLGSLARAGTKAYGEGWELLAGAKLRILREFSFKTFFWMRSSADGRFIGNGASSSTGAMISDLQRDKDIPVHASYDPGFFPDNSGFMFQSTPIGAGFCGTNLLTSNPREINFGEAQCSSATNVGLYQHLASGLGGADHYAINGQFTSDNGGDGPDEEPIADFGSDSTIKLTALAYDGNHYVEKTPVTTDSPFEGDNVLSPSSRLVISRLAGPNNKQLGYVVRKINVSATSLSTTEVGRYCVKGAKPAISFDERYAVLHHYVEEGDFAELGFASASDAGFQALLDAGSANIYVLDLVTGVKTRVTNMKPGQFALFPHFRSDNWFYFLVRDSKSGKEYAVASDAALVLAGQ